MSIKKFDPSGCLYDLNDYWGRVQNFMDKFDVRTLLATEEEIYDAQEKIVRWKEVTLEGSELFEGEKLPTDEELWEAKKLVDSAIHPDSNEIVPKPFRMSAFVLANIPLVSGIAMSTSSTFWSLFWQWMNQSFNAAVNYSNRNQSGEELTERDLAINYGAATGVSMGVSYFFQYLLRQAKEVPASAMPFLRAGVPFAAVAAAGCSNIYLMRRSELDQGVDIFDEEGNCVGKSRNAAEKGIKQVMLQRGIILPGPIIFIPTLMMAGLQKVKFIQKSKPLKMLTEVSLITGIMALALPMVIAIYPQQSSINRMELEERFRFLRNSNGTRVETFTFNKGL
mmetsp:Transcript_22715/g.57874  ORF Transcript_22715/g.57874 Transcript_22715/m.57874 type:complete len:337 (-) Transcript_22715:393-1403(-)